MNSDYLERLTRAAMRERRGAELSAAPVRIVHMGLGAFHRAHQAWYTAVVDTGGDWGIHAFTGRAARSARDLQEQDGLFTLTLRGAVADECIIVPSIVRASSGADSGDFERAVAAPETAIVTLTITEAGYRLTRDGLPDPEDDVVAADIAALRHAARTGLTAGVTSALGRLVVALDARRRTGSGSIAVVPCDNMPGNGDLVRLGVASLADELDAGLVDWIRAHVSFVSTSVDRITPRMSAEDLARVALETGWDDRAAVIAEPFSNWILSGDFPAGRPEWERAGARFVSDIEPFERRKLWMLNGAHTLLATLGQLRGHRTVAEASEDALCVEAVRALWAEAARHLPTEGLELDGYCTELMERFRNARIEHRLAQIAEGGELKIRIRIAPVAKLERQAGRPADASAFAIAAWLALQGADTDRDGEAVASIDPDLGRDDLFVTRVHEHHTRLRSEKGAFTSHPASIGGNRS